MRNQHADSDLPGNPAKNLTYRDPSDQAHWGRQSWITLPEYATLQPWDIVSGLLES